MSVFDNKLINYGNLAEFHSKIINDSSVSTLATWSSQLINNELADKQDVLTAGAGIDISNGVISATGGDAIEDVSILPDASANKNKFVRLASDDNVYVSELKSRTSTTTNRLPDAQQIDKAYIIHVEEETDNNIWYYKGLFTIIYADNTQEQFYGWYNPNEFGAGYWSLNVTSDDAEHVEMLSHYGYISNEEFAAYKTIDLVNNVITITTDAVEPIGDLSQHDTFDTENTDFPIPATYNAPESAQIGNAAFTDNSGYDTIYSGEEITYNGSTWYKWTTTTGDGYYITDKKASEIYGDFENYWMSDAQIVYFNGSEYVEIESYSDVAPVYIPQLNASDSEQVDNADVIGVESGNDFAYTYTGQIYTLKLSDNSEEMQVYWWDKGDDDLNPNDFYALFSAVNANSIYSTSQNLFIHISDDEGNISISENIITISTNYSDCLQCLVTSLDEIFMDMDSYELKTVKYQRTKVTEVWDWLPLTEVATDEDIDDLWTTPPTPTGNTYYLCKEPREDEETGQYKYPVTIKEALKHTAGDTMEYNGQTCYKWYRYEEHNGESIPNSLWVDFNAVLLTNTLNIQVPFTDESPEYVAVIDTEDVGGYMLGGTYVELVIE